MHLEDLSLPKEGEIQVDYGAYPVWFNHYMIENPDDSAPRNGSVFYPDEPVTLGDRIGKVGTYVVGSSVEGARYGRAIHVEVFTTGDIAKLAGSPWENAKHRIEDPTPDLVCDLSALDGWLTDRGAPGIDEVDIADAIKKMRSVAIRHRSEWSLEGPEQLTQELPAGNPVDRYDVPEVIKEEDWVRQIKPLCFHTEMVKSSAPGKIVGPFLESPTVWHVHPLVFMQWMNARVDKHEQIMRSQDKRASVKSTVRVKADYVVGFVSPVPSAAPSGGYPEVAWGENSYEVKVNELADQQALLASPQTDTLFHVRLLDAIDQINDRPYGVDVLVSYAAAAPSVYASQHRAGHAVDIRPGVAATPAIWYEFFQVVTRAVRYIEGRDGPNAIAIEMLQDPDGSARQAVQATDESGEWLRRLRSSKGASDTALTAAAAPFQNLMNELGRMRVHIFIP
jgi:hypothetical protein